MTNQLQQQIKVNKTLSNKILSQEKAYLDEKRAREELEKRLRTSTAPSGPSHSPPG